jgi:Fe2+ or Zn2+ uptake regulation protein
MNSLQNGIKNHLEILRNNGCRITPTVIAILSDLTDTRQVRTTNELRLDISRQLGYAVGNPTIYRICERLQLAGILRIMYSNDGIMRYYICCMPDNENHHHFICTSCKRVSEVEFCIGDQMDTYIESKLNAQVQSHFVQIEGLCEICRP